MTEIEDEEKGTTYQMKSAISCVFISHTHTDTHRVVNRVIEKIVWASVGLVLSFGMQRLEGRSSKI